MSSAWKRLGWVAFAIAGVVAVFWVVGIDIRHWTPTSIRSFVLSFGIWAPVIYLLIYSQPVIPFPSTLLTMAGGLAFGTGWGVLASLTGATLRACSQFGLARWLGRDLIARWLKGGMRALDQYAAAHSFKSVLLVRLLPNVPFDMQNLGFGCSHVKFWPYALATVIGLVPGMCAFVYFGDSLTDLRRLGWLFGAFSLITLWTLFRWTRTHRSETVVATDRSGGG